MPTNTHENDAYVTTASQEGQLSRLSHYREVQPWTKKTFVSESSVWTPKQAGRRCPHPVRNLHAGTYNTPGFEHALHNARLIEAVRSAAERGERQKVRDNDVSVLGTDLLRYEQL
jgi:hypothetical protein